MPWEVDEFWTKFTSEVLPKVKAGARVGSKPGSASRPQSGRRSMRRRAQLAEGRRRRSRREGAVGLQAGVSVDDRAGVSALKGKGVRAIGQGRRVQPGLDQEIQVLQVPSRWLHELYPADEISGASSAIPKDASPSSSSSEPKDIYTVEALDAAGQVVDRARLLAEVRRARIPRQVPRLVAGRRHDRLAAGVGGRRGRVDQRIETDPERFWDHYQSAVLPKIYDYVMKVTDNKPMPDKQPFHRDLDVEVWMSEPDFQIGVDQELVSSLESLHEDLYFVTLDFFDALGRTTTKRRLAAPGKIFPIVHPEQPGKPGEGPHPLRRQRLDEAEARHHLQGEGCRAADPDVARSAQDRHDGWPQSRVARADGVARSRAATSKPRTTGGGARGRRARRSRAPPGRRPLRDALSYDHVARMALDVGLKDVPPGGWSAHRRVGAVQRPDSVGPSRRSRSPAVTWDHIISPDESEAMIGKLSAYPAGQGLQGGAFLSRPRHLGHGDHAADAERAGVAGQADRRSSRPSSSPAGSTPTRSRRRATSSACRSCWSATRPIEAILKRVNFVMQPVENPDGAADGLRAPEADPDAHAARRPLQRARHGRGSQVGLADPLLPEALVAAGCGRTGCPTSTSIHTATRRTSGSSSLPATCRPASAPTWSTRGWYTSVSTLRDPRYPHYAEGTAALREAIVREINSNPTCAT